MKKWVVLLLLFPIAFSTNTTIRMFPHGDVLNEKIMFYFENPISNTLSYTLPLYASNVNVVGGDFRINGSELTIYPANATRIEIEFDTKSLIFKNGDLNQIFTKFDFNNVSNAILYIYIPSGYEIVETYPKANYSSDGKNIIASWKLGNDSNISIKYQKITAEKNYWVLAIVIAFVAISFAFARKKESRFKYLDDDERAVAELLSTGRVVYQNKIEKKLGFSRAKMTRIVKRLAKKGLVSKEKRGRTNRLKWTG